MSRLRLCAASALVGYSPKGREVERKELLGQCLQKPKEGNRSRATRRGISFGLSSPQARNKASTWDEYSCEPVAPLTSARTKAGCRESANDSAPQFIAAMAIATRSECDMLTAPPKPPNKKRAIPPLSLQAGEEWRDFSEESYFHH